MKIKPYKLIYFVKIKEILKKSILFIINYIKISIIKKVLLN